MATDQNLDILIQADASGVKAGMQDAKQSVASSTAQMQQSTEQLAQTSKNAIQQMLDNFKKLSAQHSEAMGKLSGDSKDAAGKMATSFNDAVGGIKGNLGGLGEAIGFVSKHFMTLAAVAAGTGIFKEGISETKKFTGEAMGLAKSLGITASEAAVLNLAIGDVYVTSEEYSEMSRGLTRQLKLNEEAINKMGVTTRDSSGHFRNQYEIMKDAGAVLENYKEGTDRNLAAQVIFGRGVQDAGKVIRAAGADIDGARDKAESLGLMLSVNNVKDLKQYKAAMNDLEDAMMAIKKAIGDQVMPIFTEISNWLASVGPAAVVITKGAFGGLAATFWYVTNGVVVLWETINAMVISVAEPIRALAAAVAKAVSGDFAGAKAEITGIAGNIKGAWSNAMDEMVKSSEKTSEKVKNLFIQGDPTKSSKSGSQDFVNPKEKEDKVKEPKLMRGFEAELEALRANYEKEKFLQGSFQEFSKQQEAAFWQQKLTTVEKGSEDAKAIQLKLYQAERTITKQSFDAELADLKNQMAEYRHNTDAKLALAQEYADKVKTAYGEESQQYKEAQRKIIEIKRQAEEQKAQAEDQYAQMRRSQQVAEVEEARAENQFRTQMGMQSKEQELAQEREFEDRVYQIKYEALQQRLAMYEQDPDKNPAELAKIHGQIEELNIQHGQRMRQLDRQRTLESSKDWKSLFDTIGSGMTSVIKGILTGTMTIGQAVKSLMQTVLSAVVNMIAQMVARWIMAKIVEMIWGTTAAKTQVAANASVAATAAMGSVAAIPFVGWAMAPEVGASTYALAMSYGILSARNGFDIPAGVDPIVQLHEKEMVLPQQQAEAVRSMADGNVGTGSGKGDVQLTVKAHPMKGGFFMMHKEELVAALRAARRDFAF